MRSKVQHYLMGMLPVVLAVASCQREMKHDVVSSPGQASANQQGGDASQGVVTAQGSVQNGPATATNKGQPMSGSFLSLTTTMAAPSATAKVRVLLVDQNGCTAKPNPHPISSDQGWKFHPVWGGLKQTTMPNFFAQHQNWFAPAQLTTINSLLTNITAELAQLQKQMAQQPQLQLTALPAGMDYSCVSQSLEVLYQAGQTITSNPVASGTYLVMVSLEDKSNGILERGSATVTLVAGVAQTLTIALNDVRTGASAGNTTVTITGGAAGPVPAPAAAAPTQLAFLPTSLTEDVGACGALAINLADAAGNLAAAPVAENITLSTTSVGGAFYSDAACTAAAAPVQIALGASSTTVYYKDGTAGTPTLTAAADAAASLTAATLNASINVGTATKLVFSPTVPIQNVGDCGSFTLSLVDANNNPAVATAAESATLASTSQGGAFFSDNACTTALTAAPIAANASNVAIYYKDTVAGNPTLSATDASNLNLTAATETALINNYKLVFVGNTLTQNSGDCGILTIGSEDVAGNVYTTPAAVTVNLSSSATTGAFYADNACATAITTIQEPSGSSTIAVYYKDTAAGTPTLSAAEGSSLGWVGASQTAQINVVTSLAFTNAPLSEAVGACGALTVQTEGAGGAAANVAAAATIKFSSSNVTTGLFYSDAACTAQITQAAIAAGSSQLTVYYKDATVGPAVLGAIQDYTQGWMAASQSVNITAAAGG